MSNSAPEPASSGPDLGRDRLSALFQTLVMQQANMALMFLGRMPHPETGQTTVDLNAARFFIDTLEMLEAKTKGNLDRNEEALLKQNLMNLRMAFVKAADQQPTKPNEPAPAPSAPSPAPSTPGDTSADASSEAESRKKFSKKY